MFYLFKFESVLEKHNEAGHENVELFCHDFNNEKECPVDDNCIFVHEESDTCFETAKKCLAYAILILVSSLLSNLIFPMVNFSNSS